MEMFFRVFLAYTFHRTVRNGVRSPIFSISTTTISQIMISARLDALNSWL